MSRRAYEDDDGRTIADMSDLSIRTPLGFYSPGKHRNEKNGQRDNENASQSGTGDRPWENGEMSRESRRGAISGALLASLLIALAFIVGFGIFIAIIYFVFR